MHRALVTGGNGFIGQHLVAALHARGHEVRVFDREPARKRQRKAEFIRGSILDTAALMRAMKGVDDVYHLAGIAHLWTPREADFEEINARGTEIVMAAARRQGARRVLHCSSETVLLAAPNPVGTIDETVVASPEDAPGPYTRSKLLAERAAMEAVDCGLDVVIVNPTVPVGPNDFHFTPPAAMLAHFLTRELQVYLDGVLNLVDVRDVANGMILAMERGRAAERYILGGENYSFRDILAQLDDLSGRRRMKVSIPGSLALGAATVSEWIATRFSRSRPVATAEGVRLALRSACLDDSKARRELGYATRPVKKALADFVAWFATNDIVDMPAMAKSLRTGAAAR